jgi:hypothetical protein
MKCVKVVEGVEYLENVILDEKIILKWACCMAVKWNCVAEYRN